MSERGLEPVVRSRSEPEKEPYPLWLPSAGVMLWIVGCLGILFLGAMAGLSPKTLQPLKQLNAIGIWVWVYLMTSPVARWNGRRGWPWFRPQFDALNAPVCSVATPPGASLMPRLPSQALPIALTPQGGGEDHPFGHR